MFFVVAIRTFHETQSADGIVVQRRGGFGASVICAAPDSTMATVLAPIAIFPQFQATHMLTSLCATAQVSLSSLNRHAVATRADVGLPKATVLKRHFATILPEVRC